MPDLVTGIAIGLAIVALIGGLLAVALAATAGRADHNHKETL